jgi:hypothetical protein
MFKSITLGVAASVAALTALPAAAEAQSRNGYYSQYEGRTDGYYPRYRRCSGTTGTIVGGAGGALLGREIAGRGNRTTGTILGVAAGALLGRELGKSSCRGSRR